MSTTIVTDPYTAEIEAHIIELENKLRAARADKDIIERARRESFVPLFRWTLTPVTDNFDRTFDDSVILYRLHGGLVNREAAEESGVRVNEGGHNYVFNRLNNRFVMGVGGGRLWLNDGLYNTNIDAMIELADYIAVYPDGGDVTHIVRKYQKS